MATNHLSAEILRQYVGGVLGQAESDQVATHLAQCGQCLDGADQLWVEHEVGAAVSTAADLDAETARNIERKLFHRIYRSNLSGAITWLGLEGFMKVILALMRPFFFRLGRTGSNSNGKGVHDG